MWFEQHVLPQIAVFGMLAILGWGMIAHSRDCLVTARRKALEEAAEALRSLSRVAGKASDAHLANGHKTLASEASVREYYFERAAFTVASIPVDRV